MIEKLTILHEYGDPRHFLALYHLQEQGLIREIQTTEFNILRQIGRAALRHNRQSLSRSFYNIEKVTKLLFAENEIIIIGAAPYDPAITILNRLKQKNKVIYFTSWPFWDEERYAKKPLLPKVKKAWRNFLNGTLTVAVTEVACQGVMQYGAIAITIPHCVDTRMVAKPSEKPDSSTTNILFVGRLIESKGVPVLLDVIRQTRWPRDVHFWFVGDGPYRQQVVRMQDNHPVKYFGYIAGAEDLASIYQQANIFVLPSIDKGADVENFGIVLIEAMANSLPVVTTDCVGPKEIVENNKDGFVIEQNNKEQLRGRITQLIENPDLRIKMGMNGREKIEQVYDVNVIAERWKGILESLMIKK